MSSVERPFVSVESYALECCETKLGNFTEDAAADLIRENLRGRPFLRSITSSVPLSLLIHPLPLHSGMPRFLMDSPGGLRSSGSHCDSLFQFLFAYPLCYALLSVCCCVMTVRLRGPGRSYPPCTFAVGLYL